jgi:hypothetical protein
MYITAVAPALVKNGLAFGRPASDEFPLINYLSMSFSDPELYVAKPSPRYWLLWPGVLIMLMYSMADVIFTLVPLFRSEQAVHPLSSMAKDDGIFAIGLNGPSLNPRNWLRRQEALNPDDEDQTPLEDRIPTAWWATGLVLSTIMCCAILATMFRMNVGEAILSLLLGFVFSFIGVQSTGYTDVNPISTVAKASQLIFGGISKGAGLAPKPAQTLNLAAGVIAAGSAAQAADMTGDLKTGYLLRAKPKNQFIAQLCGSVVAVFLTSGLFILFTKASPCIMLAFLLYRRFSMESHGSLVNSAVNQTGTCTYGAPSVAAWAAVAVAVTSPKLREPPFISSKSETK